MTQGRGATLKSYLCKTNVLAIPLGSWDEVWYRVGVNVVSIPCQELSTFGLNGGAVWFDFLVVLFLVFNCFVIFEYKPEKI